MKILGGLWASHSNYRTWAVVCVYSHLPISFCLKKSRNLNGNFYPSYRSTFFNVFKQTFMDKKILEEGGASTIKMNKILRQNNALEDFIFSIKHSSIALYTESIISANY